VQCAYRFVLEVRDASGSRVVFRQALHPDWEPAIEAARLTGLRVHGVWHGATDAVPVVLPLWHERRGEPAVQGVRVCMSGGDRHWYVDLPASEYFGDAARSVLAARAAAGLLEAGRMRYTLAAYIGSLPAAPPLAFTARSLAARLDVRDRGFAALLDGASGVGDGEPSDIEVVVPTRVLEDVRALTRAAGERETGGVLLGHVCRHDSRHDVGVEITAQVPARHTVGDAVKLTFTSDTWTDVRAAVALRRAGELLVGWWHSHPAHAWCKACPIERQRVCHLATGFLSSDDRALHRAMFPSAYTQALVLTNSAAGLESRLFGWRRGVLQSRAFRVSKERRDATPTPPGD
jgi:proteasome lid subunit RPN8/RPN11